MPERYLVAAVLLALLAPQAAQAEIFKCVAKNGEITFSQTPCPAEDNTKNDKKPAREREGEPANGEKARIMHATVAAQLTQLQDGQNEKEENAAPRAKSQHTEAREQEEILQCEKNIKAQIKGITSQMRSDTSSSLLDVLRTKRRALEIRLDDC